MSRLRPPWRDGPRRTEMLVWSAAGFVAQWVVNLLAVGLVVNVLPEQGWLLLVAPVLMLAAGVAGTMTGPQWVRAVGYGILLGFIVQVGLVALALVVLAGLCGLILANR